MQLVSQALVAVLLLAALVQSTRRGQFTSAKLARQNKTKGKTVKMFMSPSLQPYRSSDSASMTASLSLTPWKYSESYVESRLPARISQAQCLTSGCLSLQGSEEDATLVAAPIRYQVLVLHKVKKPTKHQKRGRRPRIKYEFQLATEVITVGCTCVRPSVIPQN